MSKLKEFYRALKCKLGIHCGWDERAEGVKCFRCNYLICWGDKRIKKLRYHRNSKNPYVGK